MTFVIWLDDIRKAPQGYVHCHSVNEAIDVIKLANDEISVPTPPMLTPTSKSA